MKFEYLREFVVAAQSDDMSHAAQKLGISVSVLSKHMKAIELELGEPLFVRARHMVLSQCGRIMLPYAQELCALQDEYTTEFKCSKLITGELVIGLSTIQLRERAGITLEEFMLANPSVNVRFLEAGNSELQELVKQGRCDAAFIRSPARITRDPELVYFPFHADKMVAFLPPEHPLAKCGYITFSQLKEEHIILRREKSSISRIFFSECEKQGFTPDVSYAGSYALYDLIRRGEGITLYLAPPVSPEYVTPLSIVPVEPPVYSFVDLVFRSGHYSRNLEHLLQFVRASLVKAEEAE